MGLDEENFMAHKDLICSKSPFFSAACNGNFIEGKEGLVRLPEDQPPIFDLFLQWLYTGDVPVTSSDAYLDWSESAALYVLAEKLQISELKNAVIDQWICKNKATDEYPIGIVAYVYTNTLDSSPLRRLVVEMVACVITSEPLLLRNNELLPEFLLDLSVALIKLRSHDARDKALFRTEWGSPMTKLMQPPI